MYSLFSTIRYDAPHPCQILAERASIEPVLEGCFYLGFIIQLEDFEFEKYLRLHDAISIFVKVVERRIGAREFTCLYIHPASSELDSTGAPRVVFDPRGRVLYNWQ